MSLIPLWPAHDPVTIKGATGPVGAGVTLGLFVTVGVPVGVSSCVILRSAVAHAPSQYNNHVLVPRGGSMPSSSMEPQEKQTPSASRSDVAVVKIVVSVVSKIHEAPLRPPSQDASKYSTMPSFWTLVEPSAIQGGANRRINIIDAVVVVKFRIGDWRARSGDQ